VEIAFNSRDRKYKSVFGAIKTNEITGFTLVLHSSLLAEKAFLVIWPDGKKEEYIPMTKSENGEFHFWRTEFKTPNKGLYFYKFDYDTPYGRGTVLNSGSGIGYVGREGVPWQLTVYDENFSTPDWLKGKVAYQIFPDRFRFSGEKKENVPKDRELRSDWGGTPKWYPDENGRFNNDYFCGDLKGIEEKLEYLASLGVGLIYLNPIFEAHSNHRYDTADYFKIDPLLGTAEDFVSLTKKAEEYGIKIILDGVFSHTGADSVYFNKYKRYGDGGAYNDPESPYYSWYKFGETRDDYASWWGVKTLPEVNENEESFKEFITGDRGVVNHWLKNGAYGFRLDVADELPDIFIEKVRETVKKHKPDALLWGEVWEDASNKISYGGRRKYLLGDELDGVMNYPFREAVIDFMLGGSAELFMERIVTICENYPKPALDASMNFLGTHDTARVLTILSGAQLSHIDKNRQAEFSLTDSEKAIAKKRLLCAASLIYALPGVPTIYYGDEAGLEGGVDPFNRRCFPWGNEDEEILNHFKALGEIRSSHDAFKEGEFVPVSAMLGCVAFIRKNEKGESVFVISNKNHHEITYYLPENIKNPKALIGGAVTNDKKGVNIDSETTAILSFN